MLVLAARGGDPRCCVLYVVLRAWCTGVVGLRAAPDAEDLTQDVFPDRVAALCPNCVSGRFPLLLRIARNAR